MFLSHLHMLPRCEIELKGMIQRYGGIELLAQFFADDIKVSGNNERSVQCNQIKKCWLSKINPEYRLAENILETELDADTETPPFTCFCQSTRDCRVCERFTEIDGFAAILFEFRVV